MLAVLLFDGIFLVCHHNELKSIKEATKRMTACHPPDHNLGSLIVDARFEG
jgi:hypothetical protein